jgi:glycosyltransferase involved in cell wall biosynthesis
MTTKRDDGGWPVVLVVPAGSGAMARSAQHLAAAIRRVDASVDVLSTGVGACAHRFGAGQGLRGALTGVFRESVFVRSLRRCRSVVHLPDHHLARYAVAARVTAVVTVHDLFRHVDLQADQVLIQPPTRRDRAVLRQDRRGIETATRLIAVSEWTRQQLINHFDVSPDRVRVVPQAVSPVFRPAHPHREQFPYVLYVGSEQPRKNLSTLFTALARVKRLPGHRGLRLIKVGAPGGCRSFRQDTLDAATRAGIRDHVTFVEGLSDKQLCSYYSGASLLVMPSLAEGFGLPPLEAMACGCPVMATTGGALPEVVGNAAITVAPRDPHGMADAITSLLEDQALRQTLIARGFSRAATFTWDSAAQQTLAVYSEIIDSTSPAQAASPVLSRMPADIAEQTT